MKVLILAAGYGTRLYPLTKEKPKPLLPISEKPILNYLIEKFQDASLVSEIITVTNDKFYDIFNAWAKENKDFPVKLTVVSDGTKTPDDRLGSIGDIRFVVEKEKIEEDLLVIGGDNLFDYDLDDFLKFSGENSDKVTVGLYDIKEIAQASKFGVAAIGENKKVVSFYEKPAEPKTSLIAMCLYYFPKNTMALIDKYITEGGKQDRAGDYIGWLCGQDLLCGFQFEGKWYDIGSIEAYNEAQEEFKN
ncbi:MAG: nucleotidyltransferase family protein [Candidatus Aceula meridiana]|nr:nucleotidyltransferase family protein [Candidatus Aceula meridiana]